MSATADVIETKLKRNPKLTQEQKAPLNSDLQEFLLNWDAEYNNSISDIAMFKADYQASWSKAKKQFFCKIFYHARGHLSDFLWYMGNIAPTTAAKQLVLYNYAEEFGGHSPSHEQLYFYFTQDMGITTPDEVTDPKYYLPFLQDFNNEHVNWLKQNSWDGCLGAYSAYERLDNLDYVNFLRLAEKLGASKKGMIFFRVHSEVEHFSATTIELNKSWQKDKEAVKKSFAFIAKHQTKMWHELSNQLDKFHES